MPIDEAALERRLALLEKAVFELQQRKNGRFSGANWLNKVNGPISDEETFLKAVEYGREFRRSHQPPEDEAGEAT